MERPLFDNYMKTPEDIVQEKANFSPAQRRYMRGIEEMSDSTTQSNLFSTTSTPFFGDFNVSAIAKDTLGKVCRLKLPGKDINCTENQEIFLGDGTPAFVTVNITVNPKPNIFL